MIEPMPKGWSPTISVDGGLMTASHPCSSSPSGKLEISAKVTDKYSELRVRRNLSFAVWQALELFRTRK